MAALLPKRPLHKPRPQMVEFVNNDVAFVDSEEGFVEGAEIFVCTDEVTPTFEKLDSGTYTLANGDDIVVLNGVIDDFL
jgi:hypothetical protein